MSTSRKSSWDGAQFLRVIGLVLASLAVGGLIGVVSVARPQPQLQDAQEVKRDTPREPADDFATAVSEHQATLEELTSEQSDWRLVRVGYVETDEKLDTNGIVVEFAAAGNETEVHQMAIVKGHRFWNLFVGPKAAYAVGDGIAFTVVPRDGDISPKVVPAIFDQLKIDIYYP